MRCFVAMFPAAESLGEREPTEIGGIKDLVLKLSDASTECKATEYMGLPNTRRARVLALRLQSSGKLEMLANLFSTIPPAESRPFVAHLTLGRCRCPIRLPELPEFAPHRVTLLAPALYSSELTSAGPIYQRL